MAKPSFYSHVSISRTLFPSRFLIKDVRVFKAPIHEKFHGKPFKDVYHYFAKNFDAVCIGLYRAHDVAVMRPDNEGVGHYFRPYVYTAPNPLSLIRRGDEVFYLGGVLDPDELYFSISEDDSVRKASESKRGSAPATFDQSPLERKITLNSA